MVLFFYCFLRHILILSLLFRSSLNGILSFCQQCSGLTSKKTTLEAEAKKKIHVVDVNHTCKQLDGRIQLSTIMAETYQDEDLGEKIQILLCVVLYGSEISVNIA